MRAGNNFTVTVFHRAVSLLVATGVWAVLKVQLKIGDYDFVYRAQLPGKKNQPEKLRREGAVSIL